MNKILLTQKLQTFLLEDIQHRDISSEAIFPKNMSDTAIIYAKDEGILAGVDVIKATFQLLDENISVEIKKRDGEKVSPREIIAKIEGSVQAILSGERIVLNLLQRMSGIATITHQAVKVLNNERIKIVDTRKTTPGLRMFEKYAVTCGGGYNHRYGLYDAVMIKDNHIAFAGSITKAVEAIRKQIGPTVKIEVETETEEQVKEAVENNVDIIMFDNRTPNEIIELKKFVPNHILTEASGGITLDNLAFFRDTDVDLISLGFLTHSVRSLDISLSMDGGI